MNTVYTAQDRGNKKNYQSYLDAMDAISIEKVASASTFFESKKGNCLVDIGMASGTSTAILAELFPEMNIIGVDINPVMVQLAQTKYQLPNLSFREDDGEKLLTFSENSVDGFFNCSSVHHITSYNNYDTNHALNTFCRQVELLKDGGILVVRDFVKPEEQEVILQLSAEARPERPDDADLLLQFAATARSLASMEERGFPVEELKCMDQTKRRFRLYYTDAVEFIRRKDYYENWDVELQEEYGYLSQREFEDIFRELGLRIIISSPVYNPWIIRNRYQGQFTIYNLKGEEIGFPPTNYLIAGEKCSGGKQLSLIRHLPLPEKSFLRYHSYENTETKEIYDIVERPNSVLDILPYYKKNGKTEVLIKRGYPRPLATLQHGSPILDGKHYSGYIPEGISIAETDVLQNVLSSRFGITEDQCGKLSGLLEYYTSPGGLNEKVSSLSLELLNEIKEGVQLKDGFSDFRESGIIYSCDALQLLNTAQTGALVEARLELNIYSLLRKEHIPLSKWLGEPVEIMESEIPDPVSLVDLLSKKQSPYHKSTVKAGFLTTRRGCFMEMGITDSKAILEYVTPASFSVNTLVTLPVLKNRGEVYIGLEMRSLPVPQLHSDNSLLLTVPAWRLSHDIENLYDLQLYLSALKIGESKIISYSRLGEKYFPSIGVTPEQVYPYVVSPEYADPGLHWVRLSELIEHIEKIKDAHLLIALNRLKHALI